MTMIRGDPKITLSHFFLLFTITPIFQITVSWQKWKTTILLSKMSNHGFMEPARWGSSFHSSHVTLCIHTTFFTFYTVLHSRESSRHIWGCRGRFNTQATIQRHLSITRTTIGEFSL